MEVQCFLDLLKEELELENDLLVTTNIKELEEWDSMTAMMLIGLVSSEFDINLSADNIKELTTIESLINIIGKEKFN